MSSHPYGRPLGSQAEDPAPVEDAPQAQSTRATEALIVKTVVVFALIALIVVGAYLFISSTVDSNNLNACMADAIASGTSEEACK